LEAYFHLLLSPNHNDVRLIVMQINKIEIKKILLIKPRGIGDIVLSTIVLDNLTSYFPTAEIHYLVEEFAKQSIENNPLVKKIHTMQKTEFSYFVARRIRNEKI